MAEAANNENDESLQADQQGDETVVIACENLKPEIEVLEPAAQGVETRYVDHDLHRTPDRMTPRLQEEIDAVAQEASTIVLGYGLCSHGTAGLVAPAQGLWIPRVHDCIALYLGSREAYDREFRQQPGTYYLTEAWIENKRDPLGIVEEEYAPRLGYDTALWGMEQELKNYTRLVFVNRSGGETASASVRKRARENAERFGKDFVEIPGDSTFLQKLVFGPRTERDFVKIEGGAKVLAGLFDA